MVYPGYKRRVAQGTVMVSVPEGRVAEYEVYNNSKMRRGRTRKRTNRRQTQKHNELPEEAEIEVPRYYVQFRREFEQI